MIFFNKSVEQGLNLSRSQQQGYSTTYNTPFHIQVVCERFDAPSLEIIIQHTLRAPFGYTEVVTELFDDDILAYNIYVVTGCNP